MGINLLEFPCGSDKNQTKVREKLDRGKSQPENSIIPFKNPQALGESSGNRTRDTHIKSVVLYQLS